MPITAPKPVSTEQDGKIFTIPDRDSPVWFGPYHTGKLAIYLADVAATSGRKEDIDPDTVTYVVSYLDNDGSEFCGFNTFHKDSHKEAIINHILDTVFKAHQEQFAPEDSPTTVTTIH